MYLCNEEGEREKLPEQIVEQCIVEDENQSAPRTGCDKNTLHKGHGLHIYMKKQENWIKKEILNLSLRFDGLDKDLMSRVTKLSMNIDSLRHNSKYCNKCSTSE